VVPPGQTLVDEYQLAELQRKARELETEQAAAQALRHQLMQLKDELLEAVRRAEECVSHTSPIRSSASPLSPETQKSAFHSLRTCGGETVARGTDISLAHRRSRLWVGR